jgi:hypothetical protein
MEPGTGVALTSWFFKEIGYFRLISAKAGIAE